MCIYIVKYLTSDERDLVAPSGGDCHLTSTRSYVSRNWGEFCLAFVALGA